MHETKNGERQSSDALRGWKSTPGRQREYRNRQSLHSHPLKKPFNDDERKDRKNASNFHRPEISCQTSASNGEIIIASASLHNSWHTNSRQRAKLSKLLLFPLPLPLHEHTYACVCVCLTNDSICPGYYLTKIASWQEREKGEPTAAGEKKWDGTALMTIMLFSSLFLQYFSVASKPCWHECAIKECKNQVRKACGGNYGRESDVRGRGIVVRQKISFLCL